MRERTFKYRGDKKGSYQPRQFQAHEIDGRHLYSLKSVQVSEGIAHDDQTNKRLEEESSFESGEFVDLQLYSLVSA